TRDLVYPAVSEMLGTHLLKRILDDGAVLFRLKAQPAAVGVPALQDVLPGPHGKQQRAFLLDDGNALRACARIEPAGLEPVELHATRKRRERGGEELEGGLGPNGGGKAAGRQGSGERTEQRWRRRAQDRVWANWAGR